MQKVLTPAERLIVGFDFKPDRAKGQNAQWVYDSVLRLADNLAGIGCIAKVNSALRLYGYDLIDVLHGRGLQVFADLKFYDIKETLATDGVILRETKPEIVTVACCAGVAAMKALKAELPDSEVLGVSVLTGLDDGDTDTMFGCLVSDAVMRFAGLGADAMLGGFISAPTEVRALRLAFGELFSYNTPAIRPSWAEVKGDGQNQKRVMTPAEAIKAGADRIVVARPIVQAANPREAALRTIDEIALVA